MRRLAFTRRPTRRAGTSQKPQLPTILEDGDDEASFIEVSQITSHKLNSKVVQIRGSEGEDVRHSILRDWPPWQWSDECSGPAPGEVLCTLPDRPGEEGTQLDNAIEVADGWPLLSWEEENSTNSTERSSSIPWTPWSWEKEVIAAAFVQSGSLGDEQFHKSLSQDQNGSRQSEVSLSTRLTPPPVFDDSIPAGQRVQTPTVPMWTTLKSPDTDEAPADVDNEGEGEEDGEDEDQQDELDDDEWFEQREVIEENDENINLNTVRSDGEAKTNLVTESTKDILQEVADDTDQEEDAIEALIDQSFIVAQTIPSIAFLPKNIEATVRSGSSVSARRWAYLGPMSRLRRRLSEQLDSGAISDGSSPKKRRRLSI